MNPEVRVIDGSRLLIKAKREVEELMKRKKETVEVRQMCKGPRWYTLKQWLTDFLGFDDLVL